MSFSLICVSLSFAADYGHVARDLAAAPQEESKRRILRELSQDASIDPDLRHSLADLLAQRSYAPTLAQVEEMVGIRALAQKPAVAGSRPDAKKAAAEIAQNPLYRDPGEQEQSNWFAKGFERIAEKVKQLLESRQPADMRAPNVNPSGILEFMRFALWGLLAAAVIVFLYFAIRHFRWRAGLERKAKAILADDEPILSRDEYLEQVDHLITEGRYREAVRYLYLACLLLFDEHGVARFLKGQTNWEHLRRIHASASRPESLDFAPATEKFDVVWYGMRVEGLQDVQQMQNWYSRIGEVLRRKPS